MTFVFTDIKDRMNDETQLKSLTVKILHESMLYVFTYLYIDLI